MLLDLARFSNGIIAAVIEKWAKNGIQPFIRPGI